MFTSRLRVVSDGPFLRRWLIALATAIGLFSSPSLAAPPYYRIEEDWEIKIKTPDAERVLPQISLTMKPDPASSRCGVLVLNYRDSPQFVAGGGQAELWQGKDLLTAKEFVEAPLAATGETILVTIFMERNDGLLRFGISAGSSATWGDLEARQLRVHCQDGTDVFMNYQSSSSLKAATIVGGSQRVESVILRAVRKFRVGSIYIDTETAKQAFP
jgi:hypothetical protein